MSGKVSITSTLESNDVKNNENLKHFTDYIDGKKNEIGNTLTDIEGVMEENGISRYELNSLLDLGIDVDDALKALVIIKKKEGKRDIDILMRNGIYEDVALKILAKMSRKEKDKDKLRILMRYKDDKKNKINESKAEKILEEIQDEDEKRKKHEVEKVDYLVNLGIDRNDARRVIKDINNFSEINKDILDSFGAYSNISNSNTILAIIEQVDRAKTKEEKVNILKSYGIRKGYTVGGEDKYPVLDAIEDDENNKFSAERHGKPEKYYYEVFPKHFRETLSLYEKEEWARKIDYVQKEVVCDENVKIRVRPKMIRGLRKLLGVHDFKGGAYRGNTIYLSNTADIDNLRLLNHENIHGEQQRELGIKKLQELAPGAPKIWGFIRRCAESFVKGPILWKFDHKDEKFDIEVLTTSVRTENEAYTNQGKIGYPRLRSKKEYKRYRGEAVENQLINRVAKDNYGLEIESQNLDGRLNSIVDKISNIIDNNLNFPEGEDQEIYSNLKENVQDICNKLLQLNEENKKGGNDVEKRDNLIDKYKNIISEMLVFVRELYNMCFEGNTIEKEGETKLNKGKIMGKHKVLKLSNSQKELNLKQEIEGIREELLNMKCDLNKNLEINRSDTDINEGKTKRWTFNKVDKNIDIVCVIRTLEDKLDQLKELKRSGKSLDQFKPSEKLKKDIELYQNEIANENLAYMLEDEFTDSYQIEKTIKQLNQKCYENEAEATDIWLEKEGHQEKSEKIADITMALMRYGIDDNEITKIIEDIRTNDVDLEKRDGFDKYNINKYRFTEILNDVKAYGSDAINGNSKRKRDLDEKKQAKKENAPVVPTNFKK